MTEKSKITNIIHQLDSLNIGEIAELIANIKALYNIQEEAIVRQTSVPAEEITAEKTSNVSVQWVKMKEGANLREVLGVVQKAVKELNGKEINLPEALKLTKQGDKIILENIPRDKAEEFQKKMEKEKVEVEIKEI